MKCISKSVLLILVTSLMICGCSRDIESEYDVYLTSDRYGLTSLDSTMLENPLYASDLCISDGSDIGIDEDKEPVCKGAGVFNVDTKEITYLQNPYEKLYPASTTKILTAYLALKYGNLDEVFVVSQEACKQPRDSSTCKLNPGDELTLRQLLYGLIIKSGNDAAIVIAEAISGTEEEFVSLMNKEARLLGATHSNFVTPNGLHDDDHYTCVYDMYLIFNEALKIKEFREILNTTSYNATYKNSSGGNVSQEWTNTNRYLTDNYSLPENFTMIGAKTGTTGKAGYCLVMLSLNPKNQEIISIVFGADTPSILYNYMTNILENSKK